MGDALNQARAERERLAVELPAAAEKAFARAGRIEKHFCLNGIFFALRFAGETLARPMSRALAHLAVAHAGEVSLTIDCWDTASSGVPCPQANWPAHLFSGRGEILGLDGPDLRVAWFDWLQLFCAYFPHSRQAYYGLDSAEPFPIQQFGSPALTLFSWWLATLGWQFTHAAVVGTEQCGVLIGGPGGAGKSTLAFSTLESRLRYLSDDYCVLVPGSPTRAWALYNSGKLTEDSLHLLPKLKAKTANQADAAREKAVFFLQEEFPGHLLLNTPLRAVVLSQLTQDETSLTPISMSEIRTIIARSTMTQLAGSGPAEMMRLQRLLQDLPAYRLKHGADFAATHELLLNLCAS